jgi:hypothetical protein
MTTVRQSALCLGIALLLCGASAAQFGKRKTNTYVPPSSTATPGAPQYSITLYDGESAYPYVRFTVAHIHGFNYCVGYLDVSATKVSYNSLTLPNDSFTAQRPVTTKNRYNKSVFDIVVNGRNYDFMLVQPQIVSANNPSNRDVMRASLAPGPPMDAINDWDSYVTSLKRELHVGEKPPEPVAPPKPTVGRIMLTTTPGSAQVYVDDVFKGASSEKGLLTIEASPGSHMVRINHADYKEWSQSVYFENESGTPVTVTLARAGPEPLTEDEIEQGLTAGITPARMADKVKELGVSFNLNDDIEKKLRAAGADSDLLLAIAKNKR